jgi:hypothetical protein
MPLTQMRIALVVDWSLCAQIIGVSIDILNEMARIILKFMGTDPEFLPLPSLDVHRVTDTQ